MTEETNSAKEKNEDAQDKRPNLRRQILLWTAALLGGLTFALLGKYGGWTGYYAFALTCAIIPTAITERSLQNYKLQLRRWKWALIAVGAAALGLLLGADSFEWAVEWLRRHETLTDPWTFCWRVALEFFLAGIGVSIAIAILDKIFKLGWTKKNKKDDVHQIRTDHESSLFEDIKQAIGAPAGEALKRLLNVISRRFGRTVVHAPISETLKYQAIPIALLSLAGASFGTQIVVSMILFALAHFVFSVGRGISAGILGGFYFAFVYAHWRSVSFWRAFWMTSLVHALINSAFVAIQIVVLIPVLLIARLGVKKAGVRDEFMKKMEEMNQPGINKEEFVERMKEEAAGKSESQEKTDALDSSDERENDDERNETEEE